jgi:L-glutamine-phosphate cytidylyltransferase
VSLPVAVVLAAGVGRRLAPLTDDRPKALVELGGRPLLGRALDALAATGFERVVVVTGHRADLVERFIAARANDGAVDPVFNDAYATANNVVSFLTAAPRLTAGFCLLNSDIVFDRSILADVAAAGDGCWLAVDDGETLGAEEMKVRLDRAGRIRRGRRAPRGGRCDRPLLRGRLRRDPRRGRGAADRHARPALDGDRRPRRP